MKEIHIKKTDFDKYELYVYITNDQIIPISEIKGEDKAKLLCEAMQDICDYCERRGFDDCFQQGLMMQAVNRRKVKN